MARRSAESAQAEFARAVRDEIRLRGQHGRLADAGFLRLPGAAERRYLTTDARELTYRQAFAAARGEPLEAAVKVRGKFRDEHRVASQVREAARRGELSKARLVSRREERELARATIRALVKGHGKRGQFLPGEDPIFGERRGDRRKPVERKTLYSAKILAVLDDMGDNSPSGKKARLLVAMGRRDAGADYDVGETP